MVVDALLVGLVVVRGDEQQRIANEQQREQASAAAIEGAENVNAELDGNTLTVTNRDGVSRSVNTKGATGATGAQGPQGIQGEQGPEGPSGGMLFPTMSFNPETGILTVRGLAQEVQRISYDEETAELIIRL